MATFESWINQLHMRRMGQANQGMQDVFMRDSSENGGSSKIVSGEKLASFIVAEAKLMDILISLLYMAAFGGRVILGYPDRSVSVPDSCNGERSFYNPQTDAPDVSRLQAVLSKVPSVNDLFKQAVHNEKALKQFLDGIDILIYPLLIWLTDPHRSGARVLKDNEKPGITCECIISVATSPEREARFQELKRQLGKGTLMAFHGSCNGNFHSILRTGINVMSGTEYQTTGTSYGKGVYFGSHSSISLSYCKNRGTHWPLSQFYNVSGSGTSSLVIMALVEIIDHPTEVKTHACSSSNTSGGSSSIYVTENEALFVTRFLFINPGSDICCGQLLEPCLRIVEIGSGNAAADL